MIIVRNKLTGFLLMKGYTAACIWPFIIIKPGSDISEMNDILNHERIHARQQLEMLWLFFFIWYGAEYIIKLIRYLDHSKAYRSLSHEKEAFSNDSEPDYLQRRKAYSWLKYL